MKKSLKPYLHPWPKLRKNKISVPVLSPRRMIVLQKLLYDPLIFFLRFWCCFIILHYLLILLGYGSLFGYFSNISPLSVVLYIVIVLVLILIEITSRFGLSRKFLGKRLKIIFKEEMIEVWCGMKKQKFSRENALSFAWRNFGSSDYPVYHKSRKFQIVINDQHSVTLAEVFDLKLIERLVENCNYANLRSQQNHDIDFDPRSAARASAK